MLNRLVAALGAVFILILGIFLLSGGRVDLKLNQPVKAIGENTTVKVEAKGGHGIKLFAASVSQNGQTRRVFEDNSKSNDGTRTFEFAAGRKQADFRAQARRSSNSAPSNHRSGRTTALH